MIFRFNRKFKIWNLTVFLLLGAIPCFSQVKTLKPEILPIPDLDLERLEKIVYLRESELSEQDKELCERAEEEMAHFYSPACRPLKHPVSFLSDISARTPMILVLLMHG